MSNLLKGIELNIKLETDNIHKSIAEELGKNLVGDINDLIKKYYNTYNEGSIVKNTVIRADIVGIFEVGDTVKFVKEVGTESRVPIDSIGRIVEICQGQEYPIYCDIDDEPHYSFKPEELEIVVE